jgi:3-dehydroquinate synthetase
MSRPPPPASANEVGRVAVALEGRSYEILVGGGLIGRAGSLIAPLLKDRRVLIVTDANVSRFYLDELVSSLETAGIRQESSPCRPAKRPRISAIWKSFAAACCRPASSAAA